MQMIQPVQFHGRNSHYHRWGLILAGGDGKRLLPLTRRLTGDDRPKQFCAVVGNETLLQQTQRRVSRLVPRWRTLLMLTRAHEPFYADQVAGMPSSSVLIQPSNRGTAPAILYSLMRLREMDPKGIVAFFPSDHYFSDDEAFISHIDSAYTMASLRPEVVVLLGVTPETPEVEISNRHRSSTAGGQLQAGQGLRRMRWWAHAQPELQAQPESHSNSAFRDNSSTESRRHITNRRGGGQPDLYFSVRLR